MWHDAISRRLKRLSGEGVRGLAENFISLSLLQGVLYFLPLITIPYLVRVLGVEKFGLVMFAQTTIQYLIIFVDFGFNLSATREIAQKRENLDEVSRIFCRVLLIKFVFAILGFLVLWLCVTVVDRFAEDPMVFFISYGLVIGNVLFPVWFFQGMEKMKHSTAMTLLARTISVFLIFVLVNDSADYIIVPLLYSVGMIVAGLISLWITFTRFKVNFIVPSIVELIDQIKDSFQFFIANLSSTVSASFNTLLLGLLTSNEIVGVYAAAEKLFVAMRAAFYPIVNALYPYMAARRNIKLFKKIFVVSIFVALIGGTLAFFFNVEITEIILGAGYERSAELLQIFAIIVPIAAASLLIGYPLLAAFGHEKWANGANVIGSIIHIIIVFALISHLNAYTLVQILLTTECVILGIKIYGVKKNRLWLNS